MSARAWQWRKSPGKWSLEHLEAVQGLRRSGSAGAHQDKRTKRLRARQAARRWAIGDQE